MPSANIKSSSSQTKRLNRSFFVMAKPIGGACNLNCDYCYYLPTQDLLADSSEARMPDDVLEEFIRQQIAGQDIDFVRFTWHGGEPTLLDVDFFRNVVRLQQKYAGAKVIHNDVQTNGLLLDDAWCEFFKENKFLVGLSIDGPRPLHDRFRVSQGGSPSFDQVVRAARLLRKHNVTFNTLTVVHAANAGQPEEVYNFLTKELGSNRLQWLPCVEPKDYRTSAPGKWNATDMPTLGATAARPGTPDSTVTDWSVDPDAWGEFLCGTFDLWLNDYGKVLVNWFESLLGQWRGERPLICSLDEVCGRAFTVEKNGDVYPCDHYVYPECKIGSVREKGRELADMVYSAEQRRFGCKKRDFLTEYCKKCTYRFACNGDCPKHRFLKTPDGQPGLSYLCSGFKRFFEHADPHFRRIVGSAASTITVFPR